MLKFFDTFNLLNKNIQTLIRDVSSIKEDMAVLSANQTYAARALKTIIKPQVTPSPIPRVEFLAIPRSEIVCPACLEISVNWASAYPSNDSRFRMAIVLYCDACGTGHVPDADRLLEGYYQSEYAKKNRRDRSMPPEEYFHQEKPEPRFGRYFARAKAQAAALKEHGAIFDRVLDYGSGPGYFLFVSEAKRPFAVELDRESDKYLNYLGAKKLTLDDLGNHVMDVIVASHVVEHFSAQTLEPNLQSIVGALDKNGLLLVEVPQGGHSFALLDTKQDPHTLFFTPEGIHRALARQGLEIVAEYPRGSLEAPPHPNAIYRPDTKCAEFFASRKGGLTVIARKPSE